MKYTEKERESILKAYKNDISCKEICKQYNIASSTLFSWLQRYKIQSQKERRLSHTAKEYYKLNCSYEKELRKNSILNDALHLFNISLTDKLLICEKLLDKYKLKEIARILQISSSTLFHHIHDRVKIKKVEKEDVYLKEKIISYFEKSQKRLSIKKMHKLLQSKNIICSERRVSRIMHELNLKCIRTKHPKKNSRTNLKFFSSCNKLQQNFNQSLPNTFWCGDVTMVKINGNKYYICVVMDLFSRMIIGSQVSTQNNDMLTITALKNAYEARKHPTGVTFHSDQGSNYTSKQYRALLHSLKIEQSFSKKGTPYDNAVIKSFFSNMKQEELNSKDFEYLEELKNAVTNYIDYYNNYRPHKTLNYKTPKAFENEYHKTKKGK